MDETKPPAFLAALTIRPYGVEDFTDLERGKTFTALLYRRKKSGSRAHQLAFVEAVLGDIARAGLALAGPVEVQLSPCIKTEARPSRAEARPSRAEAHLSSEAQAFRCHVTVPVSCEPHPIDPHSVDPHSVDSYSIGASGKKRAE